MCKEIDNYNMSERDIMKKFLNIIRYILLFLIILYIAINIAFFVWNYRIVATVNGNKVFYNDKVYEETFEITEFERDKCLGALKLSPDAMKSKIYSLKNMDEYILVDMIFFDHRIYKEIDK